MTERKINRAIQYVTAATSYGRDTVSEIIRTGLSELTALATTSTERYARQALLEYLCLWTIRKSAYSEPLVREVLGCAGRWLDAESARLGSEHPEVFDTPEPR